MPLFDRLHRPDALVDPRHALCSHATYGYFSKPIAHEIVDLNDEQQNRVQPTAVPEQPYNVQTVDTDHRNITANNQHAYVQPVAQESAINHVYGQTNLYDHPLATPRPVLQGHVLTTDPPLPNPPSSTHVPGAFGVLPPNLQGVTGRNKTSDNQTSTAVPTQQNAPESNVFFGTPSCDFASPTTLTTPFTELTPGPGTPPTPPESVGCAMRRVDSNFSGFSGLQMTSPTVSVTSVGSVGTWHTSAFQNYTQQERQAIQQMHEQQQQYLQQQELQQQMQQLQLQQERLNSLSSIQYEQPRNSNSDNTEAKCESVFRPIQCEIKDPTRNSPRAEYCGYTQEQIQQQQRDFMIQQQQKYIHQPQSVARRSSTAHPHGLPPSPQPLGPSPQSVMKAGSGLGSGGVITPQYGPSHGMPPPFGMPPMGMPPPGMLGMPVLPGMGVPLLPGMLPF